MRRKYGENVKTERGLLKIRLPELSARFIRFISQILTFILCEIF